MIGMDSCWQLFVNAIKTDATRLSYTKSIEKFKNFCKVKSYCKFSKMKTTKLKKTVGGVCSLFE